MKHHPSPSNARIPDHPWGLIPRPPGRPSKVGQRGVSPSPEEPFRSRFGALGKVGEGVPQVTIFRLLQFHGWTGILHSLEFRQGDPNEGDMAKFQARIGRVDLVRRQGKATLDKLHC